MHGIVARLVPERGFGFIRTPDKQEFFFHLNALTATDFEELAPGTRVEFTIKEHEAGDRSDEHPRAVNVRLAEDEVPASDHRRLPADKVQ